MPAHPAIVITVPILMIESVLTIGSNVILLLLLARSYKGTTSLNILLLSISCFNLIAVFNQIALIVPIPNKNVQLGPGICRFVFFLQMLYTSGTIMIHFLISRDRYYMSKDPYSWQSNKKRAFFYTTSVWAVSCVIALLNTILHFNDVTDDYTTCFWPIATKSDGAKGYKLTIKIVNLIGLLLFSALTFLNYFKTLSELLQNEKKKFHALKESSIILQTKRIMTYGEKTALSLLIIFIMHIASQIPSHIYDVVRFALARYREGSETDNPLRPLLIFFTSLSFVASFLPLVLMLINKRFKHNVSAMLQCKWDLLENNPSSANSRLNTITGLEENKPSLELALSLVAVKPVPNDPNIFFARNSSKYLNATTIATDVNTANDTDNNSSDHKGLVLTIKKSDVLLNNFI